MNCNLIWTFWNTWKAQQCCVPEAQTCLETAYSTSSNDT